MKVEVFQEVKILLDEISGLESIERIVQTLGEYLSHRPYTGEIISPTDIA